ncbi:hypothetical protein ACHAPD_000689 [Fusarium lateritium]
MASKTLAQPDELDIHARDHKPPHPQDEASKTVGNPTLIPNDTNDPPTNSCEPEPTEHRSKKSLVQIATVMTSLCACVFLAALEVTIVSTALPTIAAHFASDSGYTWIGTSFVLAHTASTPSWGKISDIWGRKPILLVANVIFFAGSLLCALVDDLATFVTGRAIQGVGAAVPITVAVFVLLVLTLKLPSPNTPVWAGIKAIDWPGSFLIVGGTLMLLLGLYLGGVYEPWNSATVICLIVFGIITALLFVWNEWKLAQYPVIPVHLFNTWSSSAAYAVTFFHAFVFMGVAYYFPLYFQAVLLASPLRSGLYLLPFILSISISAAITGVYIQFSGKYLLVSRAGLVMMTLGMGLMMNLSMDLNWTKMITFQLLTGIGVGMNFEGPLLSVQAVVPHEDVAAATTSMGFTRTIATAISVVIGGVLFQNEMKGENKVLMSALGLELAEIFDGASASANIDLIKTLPTEAQLLVRAAFFHSLDKMWILYTVFSSGGLLLSFFMKAQYLSKDHNDAHLGIVNNCEVGDSAGGTAISTETNGTHELRCISVKTRGAYPN